MVIGWPATVTVWLTAAVPVLIVTLTPPPMVSPPVAAVAVPSRTPATLPEPL